MKLRRALLPCIVLVLMSAAGVRADGDSNAAQTAENLRTQLYQVQTEEADLQTRLQQLDSDLRPENIERHFAGTGSTRPEELREQRRRWLQSEKERAIARLDQLAMSRTRLESAIIMAEAEAYQQSAQDPLSRNLNNMLGAQYLNTNRLLGGGSTLLAILGLLLVVAVIRRRKKMADAL